MSIRHVGVTLDCVDLDLVGRFWSEALGYEVVGREAQYLLLRADESMSGVSGLTLQQVPEHKQVKNRMHLDVVVDDVTREVERLEAIGATVVARETEPTPYQTIVMGDPEGNEFCVIRAVH